MLPAPTFAPLFSLHGRTALVTGSTRGIGRSILLAFAEAGAAVVAHGVGEGENKASLLASTAAMGAKARFIPGDLGTPGGGRALAEHVLSETGGVDIVVLNASIQIRKPWPEISPAEYELQMQVNFQSSLEILQTLVPAMKERKWGRILAIGSVQQGKPHPHMLVYAASKAAQMSLISNLARQLAPDGITANNLAPGVILTDRNTEALADSAYADKVRASIPLGHFGEATDCAGAALLLCSEAGRYITGQNLYVDGGMGLS